MQVSWIDSEYLSRLLNDLGEGKPEAIDQGPTDSREEAYTPPSGLVESVAMPSALAAISVVKASVPTLSIPTESDSDTDGESEFEDEMARRCDEKIAPEVDRIRDRLRSVREQAEAAGLLRRVALPPPVMPPVAPSRLLSALTRSSAKAEKSTVAAEPQVACDPTLSAPTFDVPSGSIAERLQIFAQWTKQHFSADELLLLDEHGDVLWGAEAEADLVLSAMLVARAASRSAAASADSSCSAHFLAHRLLGEGERTLSVIACPTVQGSLIVGIVGASAVTEQQAAWLIAALKVTIEGVV